MRKLSIIALTIVMLTALVVPTAAQEEADIVDTAVANGSFTTLVAAVQEAGLVDALKAEGPYTVFAPTDEAFTDLLADLEIEATDLLAADNLSEILLYHVIAGEFDAASVIELIGDNDYVLVETLAGTPVEIRLDMGNVYVDDAMVALPDVGTSNGVIHVIDSVLLPPPTITDIVIEAAADEMEPEFTILLEAVATAELADALAGEGPFTVFAPTDEAFAAALEALDITAEDLLASEDLAGILLYHVVNDLYYASDVAAALGMYPDGVEIETMNGASFAVSADDMGIYVDGAEIIMTDIIASNGVIHVIDAVILPPAK